MRSRTAVMWFHSRTSSSPLNERNPSANAPGLGTLLRGGAATEIANGLKAFILAAAEFHGIEVSCVHTTELKKWATGSGKAEKPDMVRAAIRLSGWPVKQQAKTGLSVSAVRCTWWARSRQRWI